MSEHLGGPIPPGRAWGGPDQPEAFYPVVGSVTAEHLDPILFSERRPADEDRESDGDQSFWAGKLLDRKWLWIREWDSTAAIAENYTHWLPASVRYLPARVGL